MTNLEKYIQTIDAIEAVQTFCQSLYNQYACESCPAYDYCGKYRRMICYNDIQFAEWANSEVAE